MPQHYFHPPGFQGYPQGHYGAPSPSHLRAQSAARLTSMDTAEAAEEPGIVDTVFSHSFARQLVLVAIEGVTVAIATYAVMAWVEGRR